MRKFNQKGIAPLMIVLLVAVIGVVGFAAYKVGQNSNKKQPESRTVEVSEQNQAKSTSGINYSNPNGYTFKYDDPNWTFVKENDDKSIAEFASGGIKAPLETDQDIWIKITAYKPGLNETDSCYPTDIINKAQNDSGGAFWGPQGEQVDGFTAKRYELYSGQGKPVVSGEKIKAENRAPADTIVTIRVKDKCYAMHFVKSNKAVSGTYLSVFWGGLRFTD